MTFGSVEGKWHPLAHRISVCYCSSGNLSDKNGSGEEHTEPWSSQCPSTPSLDHWRDPTLTPWYSPASVKPMKYNDLSATSYTNESVYYCLSATRSLIDTLTSYEETQYWSHHFFQCLNVPFWWACFCNLSFSFLDSFMLVFLQCPLFRSGFFFSMR